MVAFFTSCEEEITSFQDNEVQKTAQSLTASEVPENILVALYPWRSTANLTVYYYNPLDDFIALETDGISTYTGDNNLGFDFNYDDELIYILAGAGDEKALGGGYRYLYALNPGLEESQLISQIQSVGGSNRPQDLTFDNDGTLYIVFQGGEINTFNLETLVMSEFSEVPSYGAVGLTYDFDNNQLIYVTNRGPVELYSVAIPSGNVNELFAFNDPSCYDDDDDDSDYSGAQGIEYVGNNKAIVGSTYCEIIYTLDLETQYTNYLLDTGEGNYIKDLMYISFANDDYDDDGCLNEEDAYPESNMSETLSIGDNSYEDIDNVLVDCGTFMQDQIDNLINQINDSYNGDYKKGDGEQEDNYDELHKSFTTKLAHITYYWRINKLITAGERAEISSDAWSAEIPNRDPR